MQNRFSAQLQRLCDTSRKVLLAVSGGIDSVVLVQLMKDSGVAFEMAHANFQLRGKESDEDESFVSSLASSLGIPVFIRRFETNNYAIVRKVSTQMAARDLRYEWFAGLLAEHDFEAVVTAHHLNDAIETTLINFVRGTGIQGLLGMASQNDQVIRPMLGFTRKEIESYARDRQLQWREDSSNQSDDYQRNFIRHQIIPKLRELNPSLEETYTRTTRHLSATAELSALAVNVLRKEYTTENAGQYKILKTLLSAVTHRAAVLWELIHDYGFNSSQCEDIVGSIDGQPGKIFMTHTHQLIVDRDALIITPNIDELLATVISEGESVAVYGRWKMTITRSDKSEVTGDPLAAVLDAKKLKFPLLWRPWKAGDFFYPLGMTQRKKISDFLIDKKISGPDKKLVSVVESEGEVIWLPGQRIDDRFKVDADTRSVIIFKLEPNDPQQLFGK